jgi:hypothetical protein
MPRLLRQRPLEGLGAFAAEAVDYAKTLKSDVCQRHRHVAPARAAAPPKEVSPNQIVGVDTIYLQGLQPGGKTKMALNMVDWAILFQLVIPLQDHTPRAARQALMHWIRIFGVPERIYDDLGKEFRGCFEMMMDQDAIILDPGSLESPTQRSLTERAGKTYKEVFSRTTMDVACNNWDEWHETVDVVTATINRLTNKSGFSPMQRMLGYNPRIPGSNMSGGFNDVSTASRYEAGDLQVQRSMRLRTAAAIAYHKADCDQALRNSLHAGHRVWHHYEVGQTVYYWKKGMEQPKQDHPYFWHGPAKVILTNLPTTVWVAHRGRIIKACPEHLRPVADEEKFILTDWIQDILDTKQKLMDKEYKGYIVLDEKPPDIMDMPPIIDKDFVGPLPPQVPSRKITGKHPPEEVEFKPDAYDIKRRRANQLHRDHCRWHQQQQRDQENNQLVSWINQKRSPTRRLRLNQPEMKSHSRWTMRIRTGHWNVDKSELENNLKKVLKDQTRDIRQNCWRSYTSSWNR